VRAQSTRPKAQTRPAQGPFRRWNGVGIAIIAMKQNETAHGAPHGSGRPRSDAHPSSKRRGAAEQGVVVWVTGLPASGKSTFGRALLESLRAEGQAACLLDGDDVRAALEPKLGYDDAGREAFYGTLASLASLLSHQGLAVVVAATAHRRAYRERARELSPAFVEVFVDVPLGECRRRDDKGLYEGVWVGAVHSLPGPQVDYEAPERPDVVARHGDDPASIAEVVQAVRKCRVPHHRPRESSG
jgi:adenylylsulfate kinase